MKIGRNQPCHCGSGKKYKRCHGAHGGQPKPAIRQEQVQRFYEQFLAKEQMRKEQQGLGRPILSAKLNDRQVIIVGDKIFHSTKWKTFPDFLSDYLKDLLTPAWGNAEIAKPLAERHQIMRWYDAYCRYQQISILKPGEVFEFEINGLVACYLGLAYSLYLLHHNVELQARLLKRLLDPGNFQGAYYELMVANTLLRAGFKLTLEDETDGLTKHCEFAAVSQTTGRKFWVEAKMRSVAGLLGRTNADGTSDPNPISHLNTHLNLALAKPADDTRLIFVDLNCDETNNGSGKPSWFEKAVRALERYEARHVDAKAYVIITNLPFHRMLNERVPIAAVPFGLNMPDFNRPGHYRLSVAWKLKQQHIDAYKICQSLERYTNFPSTFDGSLPSETFRRDGSRVVIGETYVFDNDRGGIVGTVTGAVVLEDKREVMITFSAMDGKTYLHHMPISDDALKDYKDHPETYFGRIQPAGRTYKTVYELFEFLMETYTKSSREFLLTEVQKIPELSGFDRMTNDELAAIFCERMAAAMDQRSRRTK
ncbi:SEC-C domain-containing protein [Bradyrhizobium sp. CSA112]|uniref:YecA family protein n=1 Tax=Bradyrhizobium sp. CSA112 TaxID=2699170 RepID=UPI0023AF3E69|nr:SEC-C domain-containing protein [Bradyrhizobium sp. CSA112]